MVEFINMVYFIITIKDEIIINQEVIKIVIVMYLIIKAIVMIEIIVVTVENACTFTVKFDSTFALFKDDLGVMLGSLQKNFVGQDEEEKEKLISQVVMDIIVVIMLVEQVNAFFAFITIMIKDQCSMVVINCLVNSSLKYCFVNLMIITIMGTCQNWDTIITEVVNKVIINLTTDVVIIRVRFFNSIMIINYLKTFAVIITIMKMSR